MWSIISVTKHLYMFERETATAGVTQNVKTSGKHALFPTSQRVEREKHNVLVRALTLENNDWVCFVSDPHRDRHKNSSVPHHAAEKHWAHSAYRSQFAPRQKSQRGFMDKRETTCAYTLRPWSPFVLSIKRKYTACRCFVSSWCLRGLYMCVCAKKRTHPHVSESKCVKLAKARNSPQMIKLSARQGNVNR